MCLQDSILLRLTVIRHFYLQFVCCQKYGNPTYINIWGNLPQNPQNHVLAWSPNFEFARLCCRKNEMQWCFWLHVYNRFFMEEHLLVTKFSSFGHALVVTTQHFMEEHLLVTKFSSFGHALVVTTQHGLTTSWFPLEYCRSNSGSSIWCVWNFVENNTWLLSITPIMKIWEINQRIANYLLKTKYLHLEWLSNVTR